MKIRNGLVSNSSTSSFIVNTMMYGGLVMFPFVFGLITYKNRFAIQKVFQSLKTKWAKSPIN